MFLSECNSISHNLFVALAFAMQVRIKCVSPYTKHFNKAVFTGILLTPLSLIGDLYLGT